MGWNWDFLIMQWIFLTETDKYQISYNIENNIYSLDMFKSLIDIFFILSCLVYVKTKDICILSQPFYY